MRHHWWGSVNAQRSENPETARPGPRCGAQGEGSGFGRTSRAAAPISGSSAPRPARRDILSDATNRSRRCVRGVRVSWEHVSRVQVPFHCFISGEREGDNGPKGETIPDSRELHPSVREFVDSKVKQSSEV